MTAVVFLAGLTLGATLAVWVTRRVMLVRYDLHNYRKVELDTAQWRTVVTQLDHTERELRREKDAHAPLRDAVGDLLDTVHRLQAARRYPLDYGTHRQASA